MIRGNAWSVKFLRGQQRVGRYRNFSEPERVLELLRRGHATDEQIIQAHEAMRQNGKGSTYLNLTDEQFCRLSE